MNTLIASSGISDPNAFKASTRTHWNSCADGWDANSAIIREWLREATDAMLEMAQIRPGARVLDVAAGAGDQTLDIARRVGASGYVLATDLSPTILLLAEKNVRGADYSNVHFEERDGEDLGITPKTFDAAISRLGLMLMPDPGKGLSQMFQSLKPDGRCCVMVFSSAEMNPTVGIVLSTALKHAGMPPKDPHQPGALLSLGRPGRLDDLFLKAGFTQVATTKVSAPFELPHVDEYLEFLRTSASPVVQILSDLDDSAQAAAWSEIKHRLSEFNTSDGWSGPNELLLTVGQR